jgi:metallo-beta-lactamase family protein
MKITFLGANHEVTGSCTLIEAAGQRFLIDCGMEQGKDVYENQPIPVAPGEIDWVLATHAHIDHTGMLPLLVRNGFRGKIYATNPTVELCGGTRPIFRNLKRSGKTARASAPAQNRWNRCILCRMLKQP